MPGLIRCAGATGRINYTRVPSFFQSEYPPPRNLKYDVIPSESISHVHVHFKKFLGDVHSDLPRRTCLSHNHTPPHHNILHEILFVQVLYEIGSNLLVLCTHSSSSWCCAVRHGASCCSWSQGSCPGTAAPAETDRSTDEYSFCTLRGVCVEGM